jgi:predicted nucleic acid-binding protein
VSGPLRVVVDTSSLVHAALDRGSAAARLLAVAAVAELVEPEVTVADCRDPGDDKFLEAALAGGAEVIVSDDRDLLALDLWRGMRVLKPEALLAALLDER